MFSRILLWNRLKICLEILYRLKLIWREGIFWISSYFFEDKVSAIEKEEPKVEPKPNKAEVTKKEEITKTSAERDTPVKQPEKNEFEETANSGTIYAETDPTRQKDVYPRTETFAPTNVRHAPPNRDFERSRRSRRDEDRSRRGKR